MKTLYEEMCINLTKYIRNIVEHGVAKVRHGGFSINLIVSFKFYYASNNLEYIFPQNSILKVLINELLLHQWDKSSE